ncbi:MULTISPECIES: alpha/beta fold hydrolase [unclassified Microbacterium]|uniref:alpha/beta fold hydrolase n=1 Tax=unclassified Microbacterium TaxID=2609290 RepID=UPI0012FBBAAC|nr:alpha/beta hydrolase [Microbacterium sp. MAH-37]MVQ43979.1 alpha/beta fold hydrolase [Microbacterium sp. MAH-37]
MSIATSADGTPIEYSATGDGRTIVIVNGALSTAADAAPLAQALTDAGFRAITWDRRARGGSGDRRGSTPEDEAADLAAVIAAAGGADAVLGHSSGAVLALFAASQGVPTGALFLSEPPLDHDGSAVASDLAERLQALVDDGQPGEAVEAFQIEAVGLPREMVEAGRTNGMLDALIPLAQSTVYDTRLVRRMSRPTPDLLTVDRPVSVLRGEQTFPFLIGASDWTAAQIPGAELVVVPESVMHRPDPAATARVIAARL